MQIYSNLFNAFLFLNLRKVLILLTFYREIEGLWILGFWIVVVPHSPQIALIISVLLMLHPFLHPLM